MKKILIAATLTVFAASPALAQQGPWSAWQTSPRYNNAPSQAYMYGPSQAYMYAPAPGYGQPGQFMGAPSTAVIDGGIYIGQDPDANVRLQLRRDALVNDGITSGTPF